jgi:hypothetical protein
MMMGAGAPMRRTGSCVLQSCADGWALLGMLRVQTAGALLGSA